MKEEACWIKIHGLAVTCKGHDVYKIKHGCCQWKFFWGSHDAIEEFPQHWSMPGSVCFLALVLLGDQNTQFNRHQALLFRICPIYSKLLRSWKHSWGSASFPELQASEVAQVKCGATKLPSQTVTQVRNPRPWFKGPWVAFYLSPPQCSDGVKSERGLSCSQRTCCLVGEPDPCIKAVTQWRKCNSRGRLLVQKRAHPPGECRVQRGVWWGKCSWWEAGGVFRKEWSFGLARENSLCGEK